MMTTFAALFGAMPIAFGQGAGSELRRPLGIAIVGGLLVSQWLTLYTTPVIYLYLERLSRWLGRAYRPSRMAEALTDLPRPALAEIVMAPNDSVATDTGCEIGEDDHDLPEGGRGRAFGFLVHDVSRLIKRRFERRARQMGLPITRQQAAVVLNIASHEGVSQAEVAAWLGIEPIALVRMLDKLHEEGLVERRSHPTDRRVRTLWLTPDAGPVVERILAINEAIRFEAFVGLPPKTRDAVINVLSQIKGQPDSCRKRLRVTVPLTDLWKAQPAHAGQTASRPLRPVPWQGSDTTF